MAVHGRSRHGTVAGCGSTGARLARSGWRDWREDHRSDLLHVTTSWLRGSATCHSLSLPALSALLEDEVGEAPELKDVGGRGLREMTRLGASPFSCGGTSLTPTRKRCRRRSWPWSSGSPILRENLQTPELREEFDKANRFRRE